MNPQTTAIFFIKKKCIYILDKKCFVAGETVDGWEGKENCWEMKFSFFFVVSRESKRISRNLFFFFFFFFDKEKKKMIKKKLKIE